MRLLKKTLKMNNNNQYQQFTQYKADKTLVLYLVLEYITNEILNITSRENEFKNYYYRDLKISITQLVGWLEGLFHGIQAAMFAQQAAARQQFDELRRRGLLSQNPQSSDASPDAPTRGGPYL
jgi:hypothetical protein